MREITVCAWEIINEFASSNRAAFVTHHFANDARTNDLHGGTIKSYAPYPMFTHYLDFHHFLNHSICRFQLQHFYHPVIILHLRGYSEGSPHAASRHRSRRKGRLEVGSYDRIIIFSSKCINLGMHQRQICLLVEISERNLASCH